MTIIFLILPSLQGCLQVEDESDTTIRLATTTSLRDSGLLDELLTDFTKTSSIEVDVIAVGSGAAMSLAENGDVDVLIVHDPIRELEFIEADMPKTAQHLHGIVLFFLVQKIFRSFLETLDWIIENENASYPGG